MTFALHAAKRTLAPSLFGRLDQQAPDALLGLISLYNADARPSRLDLGVGVYRDEAGATPIMRSVKDAEAGLLDEQATKSYLGADGDAVYCALMAEVALGERLAASDRITGVQTPGGTGALRLGAEVIARARPEVRVWIGAPSWANHTTIMREAGLTVQSHRFYDIAAGAIDFTGMMDDLACAEPGDILLLHGCCHNPSGASFTGEQWAQIRTFCLERGLVPFIDLAYQGLGDGLEEDAAAMRALVELLPEVLIAYSCDKNFGLYRERVGALWLQTASSAAATLARSNMLVLARCMWSMPPDHGASIVRIILGSTVLRADWQDELTTMRLRINGLRAALGHAHPSLFAIAKQRGMFALLPITRADVAMLREAHGIYMAPDGRINIAGLTLGRVPDFVAVLTPLLPSAQG